VRQNKVSDTEKQFFTFITSYKERTVRYMQNSQVYAEQSDILIDNACNMYQSFRTILNFMQTDMPAMALV